MAAPGSGRQLPWLLQALLAVSAAAGVRAFLKLLLRFWTSGFRRKLKGGPKVQHMVLLWFPDLVEDSDDRRRFDEILEKMNTLPGIKACFQRYGTKAMDKEALLQELGRPDVSHGATHCLYLVADDIPSLATYLHGPVQTEELSPQLGKFLSFVHVMDTALCMELVPSGASAQDMLLQLVFLRFQPHVTRDSAVYRSFQELVSEFGKHKGIRASLQHAGWGDLSKDQVVQQLRWHDRTLGFSHVLSVAADSVADLRALLCSEVYAKWLKTEAPHLFNDGSPPVIIFHMPLEAERFA